VEHKSERYNNRAYIYSLLLHGALLLLMLNIKVLFEVEPPTFYELNLGTVSQQRIKQILEESASKQQASTPEGRVEVPKRRMIEIEEPTISVPAEQRIESQDIVTNAEKLSIEVKSPEIRIPSLNREIISMDRKERFQGSKITVGEQPGAGMETRIIGADEVINFVIEGEIKGRKILSNPLPEYPEGLNKNATIKIAFEVLPNGAVSSTGMIPIRKEDAVLEELAMNSLKLWRFSRLPESNNQNQKGIITFIFKVK